MSGRPLSRVGRLLVLRWPGPLAVAFCGVAGTLLPAVFALLAGVAEPAVHDEFSYLLGADTFARGRLANPALALPEFFEAPHVIVSPAYGSKYPPGQALVLAVGQLAGGHPIWGVWLGCGLFAASLCWMLQAWSSRPWALAITLVMAVTLGTYTYWAQSYCGGMLAAAGAALLFGGMARTLRSPHPISSALTGLGVTTLALTRPFEGLLLCLPAAVLVAGWVRETRVSAPAILRHCVLPFGAVVMLGGVFLAAHNHAMTGSWRQTPHGMHLRQYFHQGLFVTSGPRPPERVPVERVAQFYGSTDAAPVLEGGLTPEVTRNLASRLLATVVFGLGLADVPHADREPYRGMWLWLPLLAVCPWPRGRWVSVAFWLSAAFVDSLVWWHVPAYATVLKPLLLVLWLALFVATRRSNRWLPFIGLTVFAVLLGQSFVWWWFPHYGAPLVPPLAAAVALAVQQMTRHVHRYTPARYLAPAVAVLLAVHSAGAAVVYGSVVRSSAGDPGRRVLQLRSDLLRAFEAQGGSHLVFVRYGDDVSSHSEWVYNAADLDGARVIFAHDLGRDRNPALVAAYPGRSVWVAKVSRGAAVLEPYAALAARGEGR